MKAVIAGRESRESGPAAVACPVCHKPPVFLYTIDRFSQPFDILQCPDCGLQMQAAIPADASHLYGEEYYSGKAQYVYRDERLKQDFDRHVWKARLQNIARTTPPPGDFLDVGCAFGGLVEEAGRLGYAAYGLDVSEAAVQSASNRGLNVIHGRLSENAFPGRHFDVITMIEVLEHVENPRDAMTALSRLVRPGGLLVIQTANFLGRQAKTQGSSYHYYLPGHFFYYSTHNLRLLLEQFGFHAIRFYRPVDFGLLPKLLKSRGDFTSMVHYWKWLRIAWYHLKGKIAWGDFSMTSSMVVYAVRDKDRA